MGTPLALTGIDPRLLRDVTEKALQRYRFGAVDLLQDKAIEDIRVAAALGYRNARSFIAGKYPRSVAVRRIAPLLEAIRCALDDFVVDGSEHELGTALIRLTGILRSEEGMRLFQRT